MSAGSITDVLSLLDAHYDTLFRVKPYADKTDHPVPCDTRAWSQILISLLTETKGRKRKKGTDLLDGSDVKGANCWKRHRHTPVQRCDPSWSKERNIKEAGRRVGSG